MGSTNSTAELSEAEASKMLEKMVPYDEIISQRFGRVKIFKINERICRYFQRFREVAVYDQKTANRFRQKQEWYSSIRQHKNIVKIEFSKLTESNEMCIHKIILDLYASYYNHTLENTIDIKLKRSLRFKEGDLFYILDSLLSVASVMHEKLGKIYTGLFSLKDVFISPDGFIKIYPYPIEFEVASKVGGMRKVHSYTESGHEELVLHLSRKTSDSTSSPQKEKNEKDDLKEIGLILLQLILLNKNQQQFTYLTDEMLEKMVQGEFKQHRISQRFKQLLWKVIVKHKILTVEEVLEELKHIKDNEDVHFSTTIRLDQGPLLIESSPIQRAEKLKSLAQNRHLVASSIHTLSNPRAKKA